MGDEVRAQRALDGEFEHIAYTFAGTREAKLLADILETFKEGDVDRFTDVVYEFDQISKLDPWRTTIMLRIKESLAESSAGAVDLT